MSRPSQDDGTWIDFERNLVKKAIATFLMQRKSKLSSTTVWTAMINVSNFVLASYVLYGLMIFEC